MANKCWSRTDSTLYIRPDSQTGPSHGKGKRASPPSETFPNSSIAHCFRVSNGSAQYTTFKIQLFNTHNIQEKRLLVNSKKKLTVTNTSYQDKKAGRDK
jgi:hypothetical protein